MYVQDLAGVIHENAVRHGWWDEEREDGEIVALIHSEWSEALEEARNRKPLVYKVVSDGYAGKDVTPGDPEYEGSGGKPEGAAVELIDGCIRILDLFGELELEFTDNETGEPKTMGSLYEEGDIEESIPKNLPSLVTVLHAFTSLFALGDDNEENVFRLMSAMKAAMTWIRMQGIDPLKLLVEKHEYNKGRPYRHGKAF